MKSIRRTLIIVTILLVLTQFILNLLTNYASFNKPAFFVEYPSAVWLLIGICVVVIVIASLFLGHNEVAVQPTTATDPSLGARKTKGNTNYYDVFISYSHIDSNWVNRVLVPKLEKHGFSVFIDTKFTGGEFGLSQIEKGVQNCRHVISVFSPEYFNSEWATLENVMAQSLDPATRKRKLIPVLLRDADIPLRLKVIHYRDLRNDDSNQWNQLIQDLI